MLAVWLQRQPSVSATRMHYRPAPPADPALGRYGVLLALVALILFGWLRYDNFLGAYNVLTVLRYNACSRWWRWACASSS